MAAGRRYVYKNVMDEPGRHSELKKDNNYPLLSGYFITLYIFFDPPITGPIVVTIFTHGVGSKTIGTWPGGSRSSLDFHVVIFCHILIFI